MLSVSPVYHPRTKDMIFPERHSSALVAFDIDWSPQHLRHGFKKSNYFAVGGGVDDLHDCPSNDFHFTSILFPEEPRVDGEVSKAAVAETNRKAKFFELLLQGSLNMHTTDGWPLAIGRGHATLHVEPMAFQVDSLYEREFRATESLARHAVLATAVPDYAYLLLTLQMGNSWPNWFKVVESIASEYPSPTKKKPDASPPPGLLLDEDLRRRFDYTANNPQVTGLQSRHGRNGWNASAKIEPMSAGDGHALVLRLMKGYAEQKCREFAHWI